MRARDIFTDDATKVFQVLDNGYADVLDWIIEVTPYKLIPNGEGSYIVRAKTVYPDTTTDCYMTVSTPERIAETVIKMNSSGNIVVEKVEEQVFQVIPAIASLCYGNYDLYYAKENPEAGINVLREGLAMQPNNIIIAEDLGYILRDEDLIDEAIDAFLLSVKNGPSSEYIYYELSQLYLLAGDEVMAKLFEGKFKEG